MSTRVIKGGKGGTWVGATFIPEGEHRHFEEYELPPHLRGPVKPAVPAEERPEQPDPMLELIDKTVAEIEAAISGLSDAELDELQELNDVGETRKGVAQAITEEKESREQLRQAAEELLLKESGEVVAGLQELTDYQMDYALDFEQNNQDRAEVVDGIKALQEAEKTKPEE